MIQRHRHPGSDHTHTPRAVCPTCDIDHGPGPVGKRPGHVLGGVPVSQGIGIMKLGLQPMSASKAARLREERKRQAAT